MVARHRVAAAALALACAGCLPADVFSAPASYDPPMPIPVWISPAFTPAEHAEIEHALDVWNTALDGYLRFHLTAAPLDVVIEPAPVTSERLLGLTRGGVVDLYAGWNATVVLHELGHVLGLSDNTNDVGTLMGKPIDHSTPCVDAHTLDLITRRKGYDRARLRVTCL